MAEVLKTEQIVTYLLVSTVITIFVMLVLYTMMESVGNGGVYWGYDGRKEPRIAAREAVEAGDYRFLDVNLPPYQDRLTVYTPAVESCSDYPFDQVRVVSSSDAPLHAGDSRKLAIRFAGEYNEVILWELYRRYGTRCSGSYSWRWAR